MRESTLQKRCLQWVSREYRGKLLAVNIHGGGYSNKGFPDLIVFGYGRAVAIELKADSGYQVQPDQIVWRSRFLKAGIPHYVTRDLEQFKTIVKEEFNEAERQAQRPEQHG